MAQDVSATATAEALITLLEEENRALSAGDTAMPVSSLGNKRSLIERLSAGPNGQAALSRASAQRLAAAAQRNSQLLDAAIKGQRELMKVLASAMHGAEERKVYAHGGHSARLTRSRGLTIATSA